MPSIADAAIFMPPLSARVVKVLIPLSAPRGPLEEHPPPGSAEEPAILNNYVTARHHQLRVSLDLKTLEHRVIDPHMVGPGADHMRGFGIPDHDIGVAPRRQRSLPRVESEQLGRRSRRQLHKTRQAQ